MSCLMLNKYLRLTKSIFKYLANIKISEESTQKKQIRRQINIVTMLLNY